ncbi:MAG TPA: hypothetical protein VF213_04820, partial [Dongiaceae bacterium]
MTKEGEHRRRGIAAGLGPAQKLVQRRLDKMPPGLGGALRLAMVEQGSLRRWQGGESLSRRCHLHQGGGT